jgi:hypothetical protein
MNDSHGGEVIGPIIAILFMVVFYGGMFVIMIGSALVWILALLDVVKREFKDANERLIWVLVICLAQGLGAIIYLVVGRKKGWLPGDVHMPPPPKEMPPSVDPSL